MEIVLHTQPQNIEKLRSMLFSHELVSRANILVREASFAGKEGYYVRILGSEDQCREALSVSKDIAEEVVGNEKEEVLKKIKEEDEKVLEGIEGLFKEG